MKPTKLLPALLLLAVASAGASAQRPRATAATSDQPSAAPAQPTPPPAPPSVKAKYEGGYSTYTKKQTGTINFDDASSRLVFKDKDQREYLSLPYGSLAAVWPDTRAVTSTAAKVIGAVPIFPIGLGSFLMPKNKQRYLVVQYDDPDTHVRGVTSFKLDNKEILASVVHTLAQKSDLRARGEGYIRPPADPDKDK